MTFPLQLDRRVEAQMQVASDQPSTFPMLQLTIPSLSFKGGLGEPNLSPHVTPKLEKNTILISVLATKIPFHDSESCTKSSPVVNINTQRISKIKVEDGGQDLLSS